MALRNYSTTVVTRAMAPDWRDPRWKGALARALESYPPHAELDWDGEPYASALLVACVGSCGSREPWHRVDWRADGLSCDCPSRHPCRHRARAWAEWDGSWKRLKRWQKDFGATSAVAGIVWLETRDVEACLATQLSSVRVTREDDGRVIVSNPGYPIRPTGRFSNAFEFGYRGSGPNELAYSVLAHFYGPTLAEERRSYLVDFIERVPIESRELIIPADVIRAAARGEGA